MDILQDIQNRCGTSSEYLLYTVCISLPSQEVSERARAVIHIDPRVPSGSLEGVHIRISHPARCGVIPAPVAVHKRRGTPKNTISTITGAS